MLSQISLLLGELRTLSSLNRADILEMRREQKLQGLQLGRLLRRVETLEKAKPEISAREKLLVTLATYLLPLMATGLGLLISHGDISKAVELGKLFARP